MGPSIVSSTFDFPNTDHQSSGSLISDNISNAHHHSQQSTMSWMGRKFTSKTDVTAYDLEKKRIKTELKVMEKQLKSRKFELLPNKIWNDYLLQYLCRSEQFVLSSTCTYCRSKCSIDSYSFSDQFPFDNIYWRENFFNCLDATQDSTLLFVGNAFEEMSST